MGGPGQPRSPSVPIAWACDPGSARFPSGHPSLGHHHLLPRSQQPHVPPATEASVSSNPLSTLQPEWSLSVTLTLQIFQWLLIALRMKIPAPEPGTQDSSSLYLCPCWSLGLLQSQDCPLLTLSPLKPFAILRGAPSEPWH